MGNIHRALLNDQTGLGKETARRQSLVRHRADESRSDGKIRRRVGKPITASHVQIDFCRTEVQPTSRLQYGKEHRKPARVPTDDGTARRRPGLQPYDQRLNFHEHRPRAFDGRENGTAGHRFVAAGEEQPRIGEANRKRWLREGKTSFLPEEREWWQRLIDWGLEDTFRCRYPDTDDVFSWFDYRSRGFERDPRRGLRIDTVLATKPLVERLTDCGVDYEMRAMERPSDHCPVWSRFDNLPS